jgi:ABC-type transport system involved in multi-copper enzyme maturation permease subunit
MRLLPVVGRELGAMARRPSVHWMRAGVALLAFVAVGYLALIGGTGLSTADQGRSLFELLSKGAFAFCLLAGIRGTSDALSEEKREGTLGLLFLTDLRGHDIVLGKFVSLSITSFYGVLAIVPLLALSLLMGGATGSQFLMMSLCLLNTLFFSLAVGILVSTFSQLERTAMGFALAIVFMSCAGPYGLALAHTFDILEVWEVLMPGFLLASPAFVFHSVLDPILARIYEDDIYLSLAFTHLAGWLCLAVSGACLAKQAHADAPRSRIVAWFARVRQEFAYGKSNRRRAIRAALLDRNAFAWLAGRDRLKGRYAWTFIAMLGGLWLVGHWKSPEVMDDWVVTLFGLWFLHLFFKVWLVSEVASRFIEDRRSGALELLLTTPLRVREFAAGQRLALLRQFGGPVAFVVLLNFIAARASRTAFGAAITSDWPPQFFIIGLIHLFADFYTLHWVAIWRSMRLRGTNRTITQAMGLVVVGPALGWVLITQASWIAGIMFSARGPSAAMNLWIWTGCCLVYNAALVLTAEIAFLRDFREVATQSFDKPEALNWRFWRRRAAQGTVIQPIVAAPLPSGRAPSRKLKYIGIAAALVVAAVYIFAAERRQRFAKQVETRIAALKQNGEPVSRLDMQGAFGAPQTDKNGLTSLFREANRVGVQYYSLSHLPTRGLAPRQSLPLAHQEKIAAFCRTNAALFKLLERLPTRDFGRQPDLGRARNYFNAASFREALEAKALLELETDRPAAARTIELLIHLARASGWETWSGANGSRQILDSVARLLERASARALYGPEQWLRWKEALSLLQPATRLREQLMIARVNGIEAFSMNPEPLFRNYGKAITGAPWLFQMSWSARCFFGQDQAEESYYLDLMADCIAAAGGTLAGAPARVRFEGMRAPNLASPYILIVQITPFFDWAFTAACANLACQRVLTAAADVEIYRAAHGGKLPTDPAAFGNPLDPFDGLNLRYAILPDGYLIYSVSEDLQDDGGLAPQGRKRGDIAFRTGKAPAREGK